MPSIGVLEHYQKPTDKPTRRIKRSGGQSYVNQGKAEWIIRNVLLQMLEEKPRQNFEQSRRENFERPYIPDKLPPNIDSMLGIIVVGCKPQVKNAHEIATGYPHKDQFTCA